MKDIRLRDFIPPVVFYAYMHAIAHLFGSNKNYYHTELKEFTSPVFNSYSGRTHEDILIDYLLGFKKNGFYVDIGANDPDFPGHTKRFYLKGWNGIAVEPQKKLYERLCKKRPRDTNLRIAIDSEAGKATFYELPDMDVGSTLNATMAKLTSVWHKNAKVIKTEIETMTLEGMLDKYLKNNQIDFMNIDTEGTELRVLKSGNWNKYRPKLIIIEIVHFDRNEIIQYLKTKGYTLIFVNDTNGIFKDDKWNDTPHA